MGAAGIACSTSEMSARGKSGMILDLTSVPLREAGMTPVRDNAFRITGTECWWLSEKGFVRRKLKAIFKKWDLNCVKLAK
jgi:phosphoribosylformylglycinamidine synthase